uniref:Ovule protein n=1 Tax=Haemonchus contortus TaxID=6289 RepID=A0A7I4YL33_HAECO
MFPSINCTTDYFYCNFNREQQICRLGWLLLFLWLSMILYITKDLWCANALVKDSSVRQEPAGGTSLKKERVDVNIDKTTIHENSLLSA